MTNRDFRIGPDNRTAVCFADDDVHGPHLRRWALDRAGEWRPTEMLGRATHPQLLIGDNGAVFVYNSDNPEAGIAVYESDGRARRFAAPAGLRFVSAPRAGRSGLAMVHTDRHSELWRFEQDAPALRERLARVPGSLYSVYPLDPGHRLLAVDRCAYLGELSEILAVDTEDGSFSVMMEQAQVLLTHPPTGLIMVRAVVGGASWVGWRRLGEPGPLRVPAALNPALGRVAPLAVRPDGREVLVDERRGVSSRLRRYDLDAERSVEVPIPMGVARSPVRWSAEGISVTLSTPDRSPRLVTAGRDDRAKDIGPARVERMRGADGEIESIVYGGTTWRDNPRLVLAVHGGPHSAWRYEFVPVLHGLADEGVAVIAPNQRGSAGYGPAHARAIIGSMGRSDVDDLLVVAADLVRYRRARGLPPLRLLGESYGAYLALLAAARAPRWWSHCVVLAPFLAPRRLADSGDAGVRALLTSLAVPAAPDPPDVLDSCHRIGAELLVAHGQRDAVVPVTESRALVSRLRAAGRTPRYLEIQDGEHELLAVGHSPVTRAVVDFLVVPTEERR